MTWLRQLKLSKWSREPLLCFCVKQIIYLKAPIHNSKNTCVSRLLSHDCHDWKWIKSYMVRHFRRRTAQCKIRMICGKKTWCTPRFQIPYYISGMSVSGTFICCFSEQTDFCQQVSNWCVNPLLRSWHRVEHEPHFKDTNANTHDNDTVDWYKLLA